MNKKTVLEQSSALLLDLAAAMVAKDRLFHAPSMECEPVARLVADAARYEIVAPDLLATDLAIFIRHLQGAWGECLAQHDRLAADRGKIDALIIGLIAIIATDKMVGEQWLNQGSQSRHFKRRLQEHIRDDKMTPKERLARALKQDGVADALVATGLVCAEDVPALASDLEIRDVRSLFQRYLRNSSVSSVAPVPQHEEIQADEEALGDRPQENLVIRDYVPATNRFDEHANVGLSDNIAPLEPADEPAIEGDFDQLIADYDKLVGRIPQ